MQPEPSGQFRPEVISRISPTHPSYPQHKTASVEWRIESEEVSPVSDSVLVEKSDGLAIVTLNRPDRMNGLTSELMYSLEDHLRELGDDHEVRAVMLTGTGNRAFSAGADLGTPDSREKRQDATKVLPGQNAHGLAKMQQSSWHLHNMPKPTIAAINGACAGASFSMACACDFRVASDNAVFTTAFGRIGTTGDFGGTYFLTHLVGSAKARELYMMFPRFDAKEALDMGILNRLYPQEQFRKEAESFARQLAEGPTAAYRYMKRHLNAALQMHPRDLMELEAEAMSRIGETEDARNAPLAFLRKEKPVFKGR